MTPTNNRFRAWLERYPKGSLMTPTQFRAALKELDLSKREAAVFLGRCHRTIQEWASPEGHGVKDEAAARLLRYMVEHELRPEDVPVSRRTRRAKSSAQ